MSTPEATRFLPTAGTCATCGDTRVAEGENGTLTHASEENCPTQQAFTYRRVGRDGWRRHSATDEPNLSTDGATWVTGPGDTSPTHLTYPTGYSAECNFCWLNFTHSQNLHTARVSA